LLFIDCRVGLRFNRLNKAGKYPDLASFETADAHAVEQQINSLRASAALVIHNERSLQDLYGTLDEAILGFRKEGHDQTDFLYQGE
jgi:hypothetical protein